MTSSRRRSARRVGVGLERPFYGRESSRMRLQRPRRDEGLDELYRVRVSESGEVLAEPWVGADDEVEGDDLTT